MAKQDPISTIRSELREGVALAKCRQCGCMKETLEGLRSSLSTLGAKAPPGLAQQVAGWLAQMEPIRYTCLGCAHCFPAVAANALSQAFPEVAVEAPSCALEARISVWPPMPGEYFASCDGQGCPVAVSTLASPALAERLARVKPRELCIVGKTETENIGIDKLVKNVVTNPTIRFLIVAGKESEGHFSGQTLVALGLNGVDDKMRVMGSPAKRPILRNVTREEVEAFRKQVQVISMVGCEDVDAIARKLKQLAAEAAPPCECKECAEDAQPHQAPVATVVQAQAPARVEMDRAGYFVIIPRPDTGLLSVEHYSYDNRLLRTIEGRDARSIYWTAISNGWVTQLSHAAYLGKELARAELSLKLGFKYVQDGS